jgi:hypothetical protein
MSSMINNIYQPGGQTLAIGDSSDGDDNSAVTALPLLTTGGWNNVSSTNRTHPCSKGVGDVEPIRTMRLTREIAPVVVLVS